MKTRIKLKLFIALTVLLISASAIPVAAQVTIGAGEAPEDGALLQLKEGPDASPTDQKNATKGLVLPRVSLSNKTELYPMFLSTPSNPSSAETANYAANKATLKLKHTGMLVYNTNVSPAGTSYNDRFEEGIYTWDGARWLLVADETTQTVRRIVVPVDYKLTTQTIAFFGELEYGIIPTDRDEYALLSVVPILTEDTENFIATNLFFSSSLRREVEAGGNPDISKMVMWKLKIDNHNTNNSDMGPSATVKEIHILYTAKNSLFDKVQVAGAPADTYATALRINGDGTITPVQP